MLGQPSDAVDMARGAGHVDEFGGNLREGDPAPQAHVVGQSIAHGVEASQGLLATRARLHVTFDAPVSRSG